jgi:hypothetical protein
MYCILLVIQLFSFYYLTKLTFIQGYRLTWIQTKVKFDHNNVF